MQYGFHHVGAEVRQAVEQGLCGRLEIQPIGTSVVRIGAALDQSVRREPVKQARERDRL